jgi:hypothetical protein
MYQQQAQTPERETEQVIGTVTGIIQKGPDKWQAVVVPDGSQYGRNLWTKDEQLIAALSQRIGQRLGFACNVSHWNMQDGTPVRSLWIEAVGMASPDSAAMQGPPYVQQAQQAQQTQTGQSVRVQPQVQPTQVVSSDERETRIHRQTATKVAAILLSNLPSDQRNMSALLALSERLVAYYSRGLPQQDVQTVEDLIQQAMPQGMEESGPEFPEYTGDLDIPF